MQERTGVPLISACAAAVAAIAVLAAPAQSRRQQDAAMTLTIDSRNPGPEIPQDFTGLSFESQLLLPARDGSRYFSASNQPLLRTFRNLGIKSLRIGGNTADVPTIPLPGAADVNSAFAFAATAGAKVIMTLRLREGGPQSAAPVAREIMAHHRSELTCFAIGNEPDVYAKTYPAYKGELKRYMEVLSGSDREPQPRFCGPGTTPSMAAWAREFATDFGRSHQIALITQHAYPGASGRSVTDPGAARSAMLSPAWVADYQRFYDSFVPAVEAAHARYRIEETNSFFHGGAKDVSDTFAAALWGLDYLYWWAAHGAAGLNFHTGDRVAAADESTTCYYAVFLTTSSGYSIQPLGYAIEAFQLGGHGRSLPVHIESIAEAPNVTAYAVSGRSSIYLTVINKENGAAARNVRVSIAAGAEYRQAGLLRLESPGHDLSAKTGVTLGGAPIQQNGAWDGHWETISSESGSGRFLVTVPASSAAILRFPTGAAGQGGSNLGPPRLLRRLYPASLRPGAESSDLSVDSRPSPK